MPLTSEELSPLHITAGQHETDFVGFIEAVPDALVGVDRSGVIRYINHSAETLFGYERDDLVGQPVETLVPDSVRRDHPAHREAYCAGPGTRRPGPDRTGNTEPKPAVAERCLQGRQQDGTEFPLNLSLSRVETEDGLLVIAAVRDPTDRKDANDMREWMSRLRAMVDFSRDANISIGPDGIFTSWNPAAERLYGHSRDEMIGKPASSSPSAGNPADPVRPGAQPASSAG